MNTFGYDKLGDFFSKLREGVARSSAFESTFGISESDFEDRLSDSLTKWSAGRSTIKDEVALDHVVHKN